jgi:ankyrin repeat protein
MHSLILALSGVVSLSSQHVTVNNCAYSESDWKAANRGDAVEIEKSIKDGLDVSGECGVELVGVAARHHFNALLQLLLEHGAKVNGKESGLGGMTPLMFAIAAGTPILNSEHMLTVQILLDKGADITLKDSHGWTALTFAALKGDAALARLLLNKGAVVDDVADDGSTPLM